MTSEIVLHDVTSGAETVVHRSERHIEAPNWSPDGRWLLVNGGGALYRIDLAEPDRLHQVPTGGLARLNNDHGISPDGQTIVVSESPGRGTSLIYVLPTGGGTPRQVTPLAPSWWHGWSPDGQTLTYTAKRDGHFNIFTIPVTGGAETQLTFGPGHKDGPDYTPDGLWIWYNSDHHGLGADLWRVPAAGGTPEQMTDDARVNWFPHPSPDGRQVVYLSYPEGTEGHPADLPVELRLMPADGGAPRTLAAFNGGQGTINVPSWAPDSRRFAYCRYPRDLRDEE